MNHFKLTWKNIVRRKSRFFFTLSAIAVGIASLVTLLSLGTGLETEIRKQADVLGANLVVTPRGWCAYEQISVLTGETLPEAIPNEDVEKIAALEGLTAFPYLTQRTALRNQPVPLLGILPAEMKQFKGWQVGQGRYLLDDANVVIGSGIARQFELKSGDQLTVRGQEFSISGVLQEVGNSDDLAIYMELATVQQLYAVGDKVSFIAVKVDDITRIDQYILDIQEVANVAVSSDKQLLKSVLAIVGSVGSALQLIAAVAILTAFFGIVNTMMTAIYERRREIGILQAIGSKKRTIFSLFLYESAFYGLLGGIVGVVVGFVFSYFAAPYIGQNEFTAFLGSEQSVQLFSAGITLKALTFSILVSALAGVYPARQACKLSPVEAISYE
ncbi:ABC transporter membrane protein [Desulfuromonas sp. DDH964]|uniref:ABC transporter permease n=1 Tax=Desulfuromonas sp. DDH964 TaxID=1823759 RepID=UPI00078C290F|nr:ABC transporter permease [Desulfuromonas sp. DDH964]AMV70658.1 ABC transporter membrane protein [Desulfuromonas sp. DDH964]